MPAPRMGEASRKIRGRIAITTKNDPDSPELVELRRDFNAARLEEHIRQVVDQAPPLSDEQRARLAGLLVAPPEQGSARPGIGTGPGATQVDQTMVSVRRAKAAARMGTTEAGRGAA